MWRWVVAAVVVVVLTVEVVLLAPSITAAVGRLGSVNWLWVAACVLAAAASLSAFARMQRRLLGAAGVRVRQISSVAVTYAANALSVTLPGGPLFATTFTYRQSRRWGASPVVASWQLAMAGVLSTGGLAVLTAAAALVVGGTANPVALASATLAVLLLVLGVRWVAANPERLVTAGRVVLRWVNALRGHPGEQGLDRWREILAQLESVKLGKRDGVAAFGWAGWNWIADVACLGFACYATGAHPSIAGLAIAYAAGKAVGTVPLLPGGLGVVDGALTAALVAGGLTAAEALPAVIIYRLVSFVLVAAAGWVTFAIMFRAHNHDHPDDVDTAGNPLPDVPRPAVASREPRQDRGD